MVGADYWYQPTSSVHHAYGAMVSINLPWLNGRHRDRVREEEHALAGDIRALESARNAALFDLRDALPPTAGLPSAAERPALVRRFDGLTPR